MVIQNLDLVDFYMVSENIISAIETDLSPIDESPSLVKTAS